MTQQKPKKFKVQTELTIHPFQKYHHLQLISAIRLGFIMCSKMLIKPGISLCHLNFQPMACWQPALTEHVRGYQSTKYRAERERRVKGKPHGLQFGRTWGWHKWTTFFNVAIWIEFRGLITFQIRSPHRTLQLSSLFLSTKLLWFLQCITWKIVIVNIIVHEEPPCLAFIWVINC